MEVTKEMFQERGFQVQPSLCQSFSCVSEDLCPDHCHQNQRALLSTCKHCQDPGQLQSPGLLATKKKKHTKSSSILDTFFSSTTILFVAAAEPPLAPGDDFCSVLAHLGGVSLTGPAARFLDSMTNKNSSLVASCCSFYKKK